MSRPLRLEYAGAVWHVTSRGNEKREIFRDAEDRAVFLRLLARMTARFGWRIHAFVLMGNHYHLLLDTPEPTLSRGMRELNGIYAQRFNERHERVGHLMQGRFRGILVEKESHLLELTRYVVLNPVRAGLTSSPEEWVWSNYPATAGRCAPPRWLEVDWTLGQFGPESATAQALYRDFVAAGCRDSRRPWDALRGQIFLGRESFIADVRARIEGRTVGGEVPRAQRFPARPTVDQVIAATAETLGLRPLDIEAARGGIARSLVAFLARTEAGETLGRIGSLLSITPSQVAKLAKRGERAAASNARVRRRVRDIRVRLGRAGMDKVQT